MKSGKRVMGVIIIGLLLIVCIGLVSAGLKDWLGFGSDDDLEGELAESVGIGVTMSNQAPWIYNWTVTAGAPGDCQDDIIDFTGNNFRIAIFDADGYSDLADANVYVNFTKTTFIRPATSAGASCTYSINSGPNIGLFTCSITMNYWDLPGTGSASGWVVNVQADDGTVVASNNHKTSTSTNTSFYPYFDYNSNLQIDYKEAPVLGVQDKTINWTSLQTTDWLVAAANHINLTNCGNVNMSYVNISAKNLTGINYGDIFDADSFAAVGYDNAPCANTTRTNLSSVTSPAIKGGAIRHEAAAYRPIYFCINDINKREDPAFITVDSYSANLDPWVMTFYQQS